jgi:hypothetical protein
LLGISEIIVKTSRDITLLAASVFASSIFISFHIYQDISQTMSKRDHLEDLGVGGVMTLKAILKD